MRVLLLLLTLPLFAAPTIPLPEESPHVRRVPDRHERIDLVFPAEEEWRQVSHESNNYVETRRFESDRPFGDPPAGEANITVFHDLWDFDMERAQHMFAQQVAEDCDGLKAQLIFEDVNPSRRLLQYTCDGEAPFSMLQLMLQGRDHFFTVEIIADAGLMPEGESLRWIEFLKDVQPCIFEDPANPCPNQIWSY